MTPTNRQNNLAPLPDLPVAERPYSPAETLLYYDGPLLFWLPAPGRHLLTVALPDDPEQGLRWPSPRCGAPLLSQQLTLRQTVLDAQAWHLIPDYDAETLQYQLLTSIPDDWLPGDAMLPGGQPGCFCKQKEE
jgi:hypothetical protein